MLTSSFRWFVLRVVPGRDPCKLPLLAAAVVAAGCGAGRGTPQLIRGTGYAFSAPGGWTVTRALRSVEAAHGIEVLSVTRFPLLRPYRPELWPKVVPEMDRGAAAVASDQHGAVTSQATVAISGLRARRYDITYTLNGKELVERLGFVLRGKTEYELLCRFEHGKSTSACDRLFGTFRLG